MSERLYHQEEVEADFPLPEELAEAIERLRKIGKLPIDETVSET